MNEITTETIINAPAWQFPRRYKKYIISDSENCPACGLGLHYDTGIREWIGDRRLKAYQCTAVFCGQGFFVEE